MTAATHQLAPERTGIYLSDRHLIDPRREQLSIEAGVFEIEAHHWIMPKGAEGHLTPEILAAMSEAGVGSWSVERMHGYAAELYDAGIWEHWADDDDSDGWHIAAPTIRYWSESVTDGGA